MGFLYDNMNILEAKGNNLNDFLYEGKVKKGIKKEHTHEELWNKLEELRQDIWNEYQSTREELGGDNRFG